MKLNKINGVLTLLLGIGLAAAAHAQPLDEHYQVARAALAKGDPTSAKRELKLALQANPIDAQSHFLLASLLARDGDLEQAIAGYQQTVTLEPNNAVALYNLGTALLLRGEPFLAARRLEEALSLHPEFVPAYNNLAKAYFLVGLGQLATASYKEALRREPFNPVALKSLALLTQAAGAQTGAGSGVGAPNPPVNPIRPVAPATLAPEPDAPESPEVQALQQLIRQFPNVTAEQRGDRIVMSGWTSSAGERALLDRVLAGRPTVLDLTTGDTGDPHRLLEVDATIFTVIGIDSQNVGHDFLRVVQVDAAVGDGATAGFEWLYKAAISYRVNIANATTERIAFLGRPHLATLSGTPATFIAGGDTVYKVSGTTSGDIKSYPFGTSLDVTPTLLRTRAADGTPRVRIMVRAGRKTVLSLDSPEAQSTGSSVYGNVAVTSEAVLNLNQTLILTGLSQRESTSSRSGVPGLKSIPIIKYLFSEKRTVVTDLAIIILLTPRDPAYWDEQTKKAIADFVEKRRAYVAAVRGTPEDMHRFKERYPDWDKLAPNRFASHFFLTENSEIYRQVSGVDLATERLDFDLLGKPAKQPKAKKAK